jgi:hypothetical protein
MSIKRNLQRDLPKRPTKETYVNQKRPIEHLVPDDTGACDMKMKLFARATAPSSWMPTCPTAAMVHSVLTFSKKRGRYVRPASASNGPMFARQCGGMIFNIRSPGHGAVNTYMRDLLRFRSYGLGFRSAASWCWIFAHPANIRIHTYISLSLSYTQIHTHTSIPTHIIYVFIRI